jgi:hypothetical protein
VIDGNDYAVVGEIPPSMGWVWLQIRHESRLTLEKRAVILDGKIKAALRSLSKPLIGLVFLRAVRSGREPPKGDC